jgi:hypothetical protein
MGAGPLLVRVDAEAAVLALAGEEVTHLGALQNGSRRGSHSSSVR